VDLTPVGPGGSPIRHVLFDADGVLQDLPGGWYVAMEPFLGDRVREFLHETWTDELPMLVGRGDYLPVLADALARYGVTTPAEEIFAAVWHDLVVIEETVALVHDLRRRGYGVHLGTNQELHRGTHMRTALGYDELFDVSCYSYELGAAKPDPEFFHRAADRIGAAPASILFIDDNLANVEGARSVGLAAEHWDFTQGHDVLLNHLARHGVHTG
jgi:putative hydrolase of the HAD superfamily